MLETRALSKSYGALKVTDALDLHVKRGELHAVIGPNGAGKTTLLTQLAGELACDAGQILFDGRDVTKESVARRCRSGIARTYQIPRPFSNLTVLVVGAGEAGRLTAMALANVGVGRTLVTSRTPEHTADLAATLGADRIAFADREAAIAAADIVISSTAAPGFVIDRTVVERAIGARASRPLLLIDIAVPRDIDPAAGQLAGVHLCDIDELQAVAERNMRRRRSAVAQAEKIIDEDVAKFQDWLRSLEIVPTVASLRRQAESVRIAELERTLAKTTMSAADRKRVEAMTSAIVKKLLHTPIKRLKDPAEGDRYVQAARGLFGLDDAPPASDGIEASDPAE